MGRRASRRGAVWVKARGPPVRFRLNPDGRPRAPMPPALGFIQVLPPEALTGKPDVHGDDSTDDGASTSGRGDWAASGGGGGGEGKGGLLGADGDGSADGTGAAPS
jgi:hypothetical protein